MKGGESGFFRFFIDRNYQLRSQYSFQEAQLRQEECKQAPNEMGESQQGKRHKECWNSPLQRRRKTTFGKRSGIEHLQTMRSK
jgi:hypothetical protein